MKYPAVTNLERVGEYDEAAYSGGGYFFDEVLEYRVWYYPDIDTDVDGNSLNTTNEYYRAFATYEQALTFTNDNPDSKMPVALILQLEWIDQPSRGVYIHNKGERITESPNGKWIGLVVAQEKRMISMNFYLKMPNLSSVFTFITYF